VHTPYLRPEHDWDTMFPKYRQVILDKLKRTAGMPDIEERIVFERA
jgi:diapolycopene oxygenase